MGQFCGIRNKRLGEMRAAVYNEYGGPEVLHMADVATPTPDEHEVLVRIEATAVNSGDVRLRAADPFAVRFMLGLVRPKLNILGGVFAGTVVAVGSKAKRFRTGDAVFGSTDMRFGAYAEYLCVAEDSAMAHRPMRLSPTEAAVIPFGAATALHFIRQADLRPGQRVLIHGASGAVGTAAVQMAHHLGAHVTAVCGPTNTAMVRTLGADVVIDHTDPEQMATLGNYDVVWDTVNHLSVSTCLKSLAAKGTLILSAAGVRELLGATTRNLAGRYKVLFGVTRQTVADMDHIASLVQQGALRPIIDRTYPLQGIAEAHAYVDQGHKKGNVAIVVR